MPTGNFAAGDAFYATSAKKVERFVTTVFGRARCADANAAALRTAAELGTAATKDVGTGPGQVAAGNHTHSGVYQPVAAPLTNLGALADAAGALTSNGSGTFSWVLVTATRLDAFAAPIDNTNLNASTAAHGLLPKLSGNAAHVLHGDGTWS